MENHNKKTLGNYVDAIPYIFCCKISLALFMTIFLLVHLEIHAVLCSLHAYPHCQRKEAV